MKKPIFVFCVVILATLLVSCTADVSEYAKSEHNEHAYDKETVVSPTCSEKGYTLKTCECGETVRTNYVLPLEHTYGDFRVRTEATTFGEGLRERICTACGHIDTEIIPKKQITVQYSPNGDFYLSFDYAHSTAAPTDPSASESDSLKKVTTDFDLSEKTITIQGSVVAEDDYDGVRATIEETLAQNDIVIEDIEEYIIYVEKENGDLIPVPWN